MKEPKIPKMILRSRFGTLIKPYRQYQFRELEKNTATYDKVYHKWIEYAGFILPYEGTPCFLTHTLSYEYLSNNFKNYTIKDRELTNFRKLSSSIHIQNIKEFTPAQSQVIDEINRSKKDSNIWFINLQTGQGKAVLSTYLTTQFNLQTIILCFSEEILNQWENTFNNMTNINSNKILYLTGKVIDKILAKEIDPDEYDIYLSTPTLLDRYGTSRQDYSKITDLFDRCGFGLMIYDEAHRNVSNLVKISAITNVRYQLYLSADFTQGSFDKEIIYKRIFDNIQIIAPTIDLQRTMNYTTLITVEYNSYPSLIEETEPFNKYGYSAELYMNYQFKKGTLKKAIFSIIDIIRKKNKTSRILLLFVNISHVDEMYNELKIRYPNETVGRYYSSLKDDEKKESKNNASIIIATYSSFGTGLDTDNIKYVLSPNQCNKVMDNQAAGRARPLADGSNASYFMFIDTGFSYCKKKLHSRIEYLMRTKSNSSTVYRLKYTDEKE